MHAAAEIATDRAPATSAWQRKMQEQFTAVVNLRERAALLAEKLTESITEKDELEAQIASLGEDLERKIGEALAPHLSQIDTVLKNAGSDVGKAQASFGAAVDALDTRFREAMDSAQTEAEKRIKAIDEAYEDRIDIKAVSDLWRRKRRRHGWMAIGFGSVFAAGLVGVVVAVGVWRSEILEALGLTGSFALDVAAAYAKGKYTPTNLNTGGIVLAAAAGLALYALLRQLGRLFLTNLAQYGDADERIAMTDAFLSLEKEGKLTAKEDRILILQALFRPGPGAGGGDEGMPPHWFDMLLRRIDPGRTGKNGSG